MSAKNVASLLCGTLVGAAAGFAAGVLLSPRTGAESRAMAADAVNDVWDTAVDSYERGARIVNEKMASTKADPGAATDELRAKVDLARQRMDQIRDSLSSAVSSTSEQVQDVMHTVQDKVAAAADMPAEAEAAAEGVHIEVVSEDEDSKEDDAE